MIRALLLVVLLTGCELFGDAQNALKDLGKAQVELTKTFGVNVSITFKAEDMKSARHAKVRLQRKPAGLTRQQIERDVNIVLHRFVPHVETIDVEVPEN